MAARTVRTTWKGTLQAGSGHLELGDMKAGLTELARSAPGVYQAWFTASAPGRAEDEDADAGTSNLIADASPDELIAASYSASFIMQLAADVTEAGGTLETLLVLADAHLLPGPAGDGPQGSAPGITVTVHGKVSGLDEAGFAAAASSASTRCLIGRSLAGLEISLATILG